MIKEQDILKDSISVDEKTGISKVDPKGKVASLEYQVLKYVEGYSLVDIKLHTGRHHQIRVQFASRGHYLLGDQRYGVLDNKQISLFSYYLSFVHPVTHEVLEFKRMPDKKDYWTIFTL